MHFVVGRAHEEKVTRALPVGRAKEYRPFAAPVGDERLLEHIRVVEARMQKRRTLTNGRRRRFLACDEFLEKTVRIVDETSRVRDARHVAQYPRLRLARDIEHDPRRREKPPYTPVGTV